MLVRRLLIVPLALLLSTCAPLTQAQRAVLTSSRDPRPVAVTTVTSSRPKIVLAPQKKKKHFTSKQIADIVSYVAVVRHNELVSFYAAIEEQQERLACGGDLPPCYVAQRESHFNPFAVNPGHQGAPYGDPGDPSVHASGKWQFMPGTWNDYQGYPYAAAAPVKVQNQKAREVWAGGAGAGNWACC